MSQRETETFDVGCFSLRARQTMGGRGPSAFKRIVPIDRHPIMH